MGMARYILEEGLHNRSFIDSRCENVEAFKDSLKSIPWTGFRKLQVFLPNRSRQQPAFMHRVNPPPYSTPWHHRAYTRHRWCYGAGQPCHADR
jgi:anaerobic selenocysteine-containing dehydrogenase